MLKCKRIASRVWEVELDIQKFLDQNPGIKIVGTDTVLFKKEPFHVIDECQTITLIFYEAESELLLEEVTP